MKKEVEKHSIIEISVGRMVGGRFCVAGKPLYPFFVAMARNVGFATLLFLSYQFQVSAATSVPIIGILSQPVYDGAYQYIAASYVKWLESAGAAAIVIPYDADESLTREIFSQINGVLFPGGGDKAIPPSAQLMWNLAVDYNQRGEFFPVWGTCLGFEFMVTMATGDDSDGIPVIVSGFNAENISMPLIFPTVEDEIRTKGVFSTQSDLYSTTTIRDTLSTHNITMNNHQRGITPSRFMRNANLTDMFHVTSTNFDLDGREFVSTIEARDFPFYGVQFHPEKNNFEYGLRQRLSHQNGSEGSPYPSLTESSSQISSLPIPFEAINHSEEAVDFSIHLSRFFVSQARKSTVGKYTLAEKHPLLYNYPVHVGIDFEQIYLITSANATMPSKKSWSRVDGTSGRSSATSTKIQRKSGLVQPRTRLRGSVMAHNTDANETTILDA